MYKNLKLQASDSGNKEYNCSQESGGKPDKLLSERSATMIELELLF